VILQSGVIAAVISAFLYKFLYEIVGVQIYWLFYLDAAFAFSAFVININFNQRLDIETLDKYGYIEWEDKEVDKNIIK